MSKREKMLAIIAGATIGLLLIGIAAWNISGSFAAKRTQIEALEKEVRGKKLTVLEGQKAADRILWYEDRSLAANPDVARSAYLEWLLETAEKRVAFAQVVVRASGEAISRDVYRQFTFTLSAEGDLKQLTEFMYLFYTADYLHRMQTLTIQPLAGRTLKLTVGIQALALDSAAEHKPLNDKPSHRLARPKLDEYYNVILARNLFGSPNQPPRLAALSTQNANTKRPLSVTIAASDPDAVDKLTFKLGAAPAGAELKPADAKSARLSWTPPAPGTYQFSVSVTDDGWPAKTDAKQFEVRVTDPPPVVAAAPKKPEFDVAQYTVLVAILSGRDGQPVVWLDEKPTGVLHKISIGDEFQIGTMRGVVTEINDQTVVVEVDGKRLLITKGEKLSDGVPLDL